MMSAIDQQKQEDAAFFADWSVGRDRYGLWLWVEAVPRRIIMRPTTPAMCDAARRLGGIKQYWHRYDSGTHRDWYIALGRWKEVLAVAPRLGVSRRNAIRRRVADDAAALQRYRKQMGLTHA